MDVNAPELDWLVSVDDHLIEPANVWVDRAPAKYQDVVPRLVDDKWVYDGKTVGTSGLSVTIGKRKEEFTPNPVPYSEMPEAAYDPVARLVDMDRGGILGSLCFPSFPRFCGQVFWEAKDKDLALHCVQSYNDWMIDEWCGAAPGRYIPLFLIPMWDPQLAVAEMERCAAKGATTFAFSENPAPLGLPTIHDKDRYWDPVMKTANDLELVVSMHVGSSSQVPQIAPDVPFIANLPWGAMRTSGAMLSWMFSGMFQRFPKLKIALSEGEIGWIPYYLERAEQVVDKQRHWVKKMSFLGHAAADEDLDLDNFDVRATFRDHIYGCFIDDAHGIKSLDEIGEDNVMCETDYPHSDSTWPNCISVVQHRIGHLPEETQYKLLRGNAEKLYRFTPATPPVLAHA